MCKFCMLLPIQKLVSGAATNVFLDNSFHTFFNQVDQFKQNHFLWVTAGGLGVAQIAKEEQAAVDKKLGDEDEEDPEGGEG